MMSTTTRTTTKRAEASDDFDADDDDVVVVVGGGGCRVCGASSSSLFRCSRCHGPDRYCSVSCQRRDWKRHKQELSSCGGRRRRRPPEVVGAAWKELESILYQATGKDMTHDYHTATEYIESLAVQEKERQKQQQQRKQRHETTTTAHTKESDNDNKPKANSTIAQQKKNKNNSDEENYGSMMFVPREMTETTTTTTTTTTKITPLWTDWCIPHVAYLPHVSSFQIQLQATYYRNNSNDNLTPPPPPVSSFSCRSVPNTTTTTSSSKTTCLGLYYAPFNQIQPQQQQQPLLLTCWELPVTITNNNDASVQTVTTCTTSSQNKINTWSVRVRSSHNSPSDTVRWIQKQQQQQQQQPTHPLFSQWTCRACYSHNGPPPPYINRLLTTDEHNNKNDISFQRLPTGHWQDMSEYLSCGEESVWTSMMQVTSRTDRAAIIGWNVGYWSCPTSLVNPSAISFFQDDNHDNNNNTTNWHPSVLSHAETLQSLTVRCTRCFSLLGYSSSNHYDTPTPHQDNTTTTTTASTIYWLRHAVAVSNTPRPCDYYYSSILLFWIHELIHVAETQAIFTLCFNQQLWIRLGQWKDTYEASMMTITMNRLEWHSVAKIVYRQQEQQSSQAPNDLLPLSWTDWCCPSSSLTGSSTPVTTTDTTNNKDTMTTVPTRVLYVTVDYTKEFQSIISDLKHRWNILTDDNQLLVQTTYWAQTGEQLSPKQCVDKSAGVAHVPWLDAPM